MFPDTVKLLRIFLSFAVGGILGDVFLHLLPQVWVYQYPNLLRKRLDDKCLYLVYLS